MKSKLKFWNQLFLFVLILLILLFTRAFFWHQLIRLKIDSYNYHTLISIITNLILIIVSYLFIKRNNLFVIAGLKQVKLKRAYLLLFPVLYLCALNGIFMDDLNANISFTNILIFSLYVITIGFAEELSIRGFLQSHFINHLGNSKKGVIISVFLASLFFGLIHIINFDKGIYGELSQIGFATFIGVMFGFLLIVTKRIYPLVIIHAIIDFVGDLDEVGAKITTKIVEPVSLENSIFITLLTLPCLLYGLFLMKKYILKAE